jgi:hypothetical protein
MLFWEKSVFGQKLFDQKQNNISFGNHWANSRIDGYAREKIILGNNVKFAFSLLTCTSHLSKYGIGLKIGSNSAIGDFAHLEQLEESILAMMLLWVHISFHSKS